MTTELTRTSRVAHRYEALTDPRRIRCPETDARFDEDESLLRVIGPDRR